MATDRSGTLARIDARTGTLTSMTRVGDAPAVAGTGPAGLWVLDPLDATVSRVDPRAMPSRRPSRSAARPRPWPSPAAAYG